MDCVFCDSDRMKPDVLMSTRNFFVAMGMALAAPGHVMIIPKKHITCYAVLPRGLMKEFFDLKKLMQDKIAQAFSEPFLIEYGDWGQTVKHAHLHLIPKISEDYEVKSIINEMLVPDKIEFETADWDRMCKIYADEGGYVWIEDEGEMIVCHTTGLPYGDARIGYRDLLTKRGVRGISGWKQMSDEAKILDAEKKEVTRLRLL